MANPQEYLPWRDSILRKGDFFTQEALKSRLSLNSGGRALPLTARQALMYGNAWARLEAKLTRARDKAQVMINNLRNFDLGSGLESSRNQSSYLIFKREHGQRLGSDKHSSATLDQSLDVESPLDIRLGNEYLIQSFVLEQMPLFQRHCLSKEFFHFDEVSPDLVHPLAWLGAWSLILGCLFFYFYWSFIWAASSSGQGSEMSSKGNLEAWARNFLIGFIQDCMFVQVARVYLVYVACLKAMRPQLKAINFSLNNIALRLVDSNVSDLDLGAGQDLYKNSGQGLDRRLDQRSGQDYGKDQAFRVRSREEILSLRVAQHLSGTCRVARKALAANLFAARVLYVLLKTKIWPYVKAKILAWDKD
jgi:hypothetical protein